MIKFKDITLEDKEIIQSFTLKSWRRNCELSFVNIMSWMFLYRVQYALINDFLLMRFLNNGELVYSMPVGNGNMRIALNELIEDAKSQQVEFRLHGACKNLCAEIEEAMPNKFKYTINRKFSDYIYLRENLVTLKGKKLQPKRNFINRFQRNNSNYQYKPLTRDLIDECIALEKMWYCKNITDEGYENISAERTALNYAIHHFDELDLLGGVLFADGRIVAFTYGGAINYETFDVCIEKADVNIEGAYAMINHEFAKHIPEQFVYINREEDIDVPGLRKAKLSYQPEMILEKYNVEFISPQQS
jgi:hypothetical protein